MDSSYLKVDKPSVSEVSDQPVLDLKSINLAKLLFIALGIITMIGSLVATGCLYSQLEYTSFAIGGSGIVLGILCFLISKYCCDENILDNLTKFANTEDDAHLIDFSKVKPSNIFKIFDKGHSCGVYGDVSISDRIDYDESDKFTHNFPHRYSINIVTKEKNEYGYNTSACYTFTMNDLGKVESYGEVFDNFDRYLEHLQQNRIYEGNEYLSFEHFDFQSVLTDNRHKKLRKKPT